MFKINPAGVRPVHSLLLLLAAGIHSLPLQAAPLALAEAERIAIERDAARSQLLEESAAQADAAIAQSALPDPELRLGAVNLPTDSFALDEQAMTQLVVGVRQVFPPGDTLELNAARANWMAHGREQQAGDRAAQVRMLVRQLWLQRQAQDSKLEKLRAVIREVGPLLSARETRYATGGGQQADFLLAQLRLDRLADREMRIDEQRRASEEMLARYLGDAATRDYHQVRLVEPGSRAGLLAELETHPRVRAQDARIAAGETGQQAAAEQFGPRWALDFSYGDRRGLDATGNELPDFASAMVSMSIPLFNREAKRKAVSAAKRETRAATYARIDLLRELESRLNESWSRHANIERQLALHEDRLLPTARQAVRSSESAYANDRASLDRLVEAHVDLLELELRRIELLARRDQLRAELDYLGGTAR